MSKVKQIVNALDKLLEELHETQQEIIKEQVKEIGDKPNKYIQGVYDGLETSIYKLYLFIEETKSLFLGEERW